MYRLPQITYSISLLLCSTYFTSKPYRNIIVMVLADLGRSINQALNGVVGSSGDVDEAALDTMLNEISKALLKHDVGLAHVAKLKKNVKKEADLSNVPSHQRKRVIQKAVFDELVALVDPTDEASKKEGEAKAVFKPKRGKPGVIMFVGLQGAGKTTTCTKLAVYYQRRGFKTGLVCADTFRAGAFDQLKQNATRAKIPFYGSYTQPDPVQVAREGVSKFKSEGFEVIIVDTSGRHRQEQDLFDEMVQIGGAVKPNQTLMVLDASIGQAAESQALAFKDASNFGAIILTKMDGHAKGGGAISAVAATHTPIAFIGTGEHIYDLESFSAPQFVSKLLGIGDIQGLMEHVQTLKLDQKDTMKNIQEGKFTLRDLRSQMSNIMKLGPLNKVAAMIPGMSQFADQLGGDDSNKRLKGMIFIMDSMTEKELDSDGQVFRDQPTRVVRVAKGSGTAVREVEEVLAQQKVMSGMASKLGGQGGIMDRMKQMQNAKGPQADMMRRRMQQMGQQMGGGAPGGGMPDMSSLLGGGGMPDLSQMANMFGGGGGMPNMGDMMKQMQNNPMMKNMMKQFGGGM